MSVTLENTSLLFVIMAIVIVVLLFFVAVLYRKIKALEKKSDLFFRGKKGASFEEAFTNLLRDVQKIDDDVQELYKISNTIHALAQRGLHKRALIRFNPFKDMGGNQSFSFALLDGKKNGLVLSSLHTREGTRVYGKKITDGLPEDGAVLTTEEQSVIDQALNTK